MSKTVVVLDLGSSKIAAGMATIDKSGNVLLLAFENLYSRGIVMGEITDINKVVGGISSIMSKLQCLQKKRVKNVSVTLRGADVRMGISRGMTPLSRTPREITKRDVDKCLEIATMAKLPLDRTIVQRIVRGFYIDGTAPNVRNPIGLYGMKLEVEAFIATMKQSKIQTITKCIDHAGFLLDGIYLSSMASANSVLDKKEKEEGVLLLDIGDSLTETLIFTDDMLQGYYIIAKGADTILDNMHVDKQRREALLKDVFVALPADRSGFSSIAVTGGGALLDGVIEETERMFKIPARIGIVKKAGRNLSSQEAIIHTSTIGLIDYIAKEYKATHSHTNPIHKAFHKFVDIYDSYF